MNASLAKSYELEKKGLEFYISSAINSKNVLARKTLFSLAQEEIKHMIKIDEIALSIDNDGKWPDTATSFEASDIEISIKDFFDRTKKENMSGSDNAAAIKKAMEFERKSYELYSELSKKARSDNEKRFYDELKKQEEEHYEALDNVYHYL